MALTMKTINAFAASMRVAGAARALPASTWSAHAAAPAHATASAAAPRKRRTAAATVAFVDGGTI
jgi:hypothetical protein